MPSLFGYDLGDWSGIGDFFTSPMGGGTKTPLDYLWPTALTLAGGLFEDEPWSGTQEAAQFNQDSLMAQLQAKIAAEKEMQAASLESAAEIAAAQKEAMIEAAKIAARNNAYTNNSRVMADIMAERMKARRGIPEVLQAAGANVVNAMAQRGQLAQRGFSDIAQTLASYRR